jgi:hypothetical protein
MLSNCLATTTLADLAWFQISGVKLYTQAQSHPISDTRHCEKKRVFFARFCVAILSTMMKVAAMTEGL